MTDRIKGPGRSPFDNSKVMKWKNVSGEEIPAYGVVKLQDYIEADDYFEAVKPDGEGALHFVNGPVAVAADAFGGSQMWDVSRIGKTSGTFGEVVGPVDGSWEMTTEGTGWVVFSTPADGVAALLKDGGGSSDIRDGIVSINHGCGLYTVELGIIMEEGGSGSGSSDADCDPCSQGGSSSVSASTSGCELTLSGPPSKVIGIGVFVLAYDPQSITIPLVVGTDCVVGKVSGGGAGSVSGSGETGSGSGASSFTPWRIRRGYQEHIVEYKEGWKCCDDGSKILEWRDPVILVGIQCARIICGECPPTSGSAE